MSYVILLAAVLVAAYVVAAITDRHAERRREASAVNELLPPSTRPHFAPLPRRYVALLVAAAVGGIVAGGYGQSNHVDEAGRLAQVRLDRRSQQAQANLDRCQATAAAAWRKAVGIAIIAFTTTDNGPNARLPSDVGSVVEQLDLPHTLAGIDREARARIIAALIDDARLSEANDRLCPFVQGDPERTPDRPIHSATAELERQIARLRHATTTTTSPTTTTTTGG